MERNDILNAISEALTVTLDSPVPALKDEMSLTDDFGLESIEVLDFFVEVEQRIGQSVDLIELLRTRDSTSNFDKKIRIADIVHYIEKRVP